MNKQNARDYIPLLDALADGELQLNTGTVEFPMWQYIDEAHFNKSPILYRRKPKPVVLYAATWLANGGLVGLDYAESEFYLREKYGHCLGFKIHKLDCGVAP